MSDSSVSSRTSTGVDRLRDEADGQHRTEMDDARDALSRLTGQVYKTEDEVRAGVRRFQGTVRGLEGSVGLDPKTRAALEHAIAGRKDVGAARAAIRSGVEHIAHATHSAEQMMVEVTQSHVHALRVGDSFELTGSLKVGAEGLESEEKGKLTITRGADGKYTIDASGDYGLKGAGIVAAGGSAGLKLVAATEEDAVRLAHLLARGALAAHSPAAGLFTHSSHDTDAELAFVRDHVTAVSLGAEASAELKGIVGARNNGAGAFAGAAICGTIGEKFTLEMDHGRITGLVAEASCKVKGSARVGADMQPTGLAHGGAPAKLSGGHRDLGIDFDGNETSTIVVRTHMDLPSARTAEQQRMGAGALIASLQHEITKSARVDIELSVEGVVSANGSSNQVGGSGRLSVTFQGVKSDGKGSLIDALSNGDVDAALASAKLTAQTCIVRAELYVEHGDTHSASIGSETSVEVGVELQLKQRHQVQVYAPIAGSPADVIRMLGANNHARAGAPADGAFALFC